MPLLTQGPFHAGAASSVAGVGTAPWNSPGNIIGGASFTTSFIDTTSGITNSDFLYGTQYGFTIPTSAQITAILTEIFKKDSNPHSIGDQSIKMLKAGAPIGSDLAIGGAWPALPGAYVSYNGMVGWAPTPADVNNVGFGAYVQAINNDGTHARLASVQDIRITITYNLPTGFFVVETDS